ncbi:MAG: hypothetical protein JWO07_800 [Candidatus Saccharibacteria bacterium]|nr:hypothetical protein [Candidatus Saccharibacteria bacterium]
MDSLADTAPSLPVMLAYGLVILLYLVILRLLLNFLQQLSDKHHRHQSIIDRGIRAMKSHRIDGSMQAFDPYTIAVIIAKGGIATISMAVVIVLLVTKVGPTATAALLVAVILVAWAVNHWLKSREKVGTIKEIRTYIQKSGSIGSVVVLSIALVVLLFIMVMLH